MLASAARGEIKSAHAQARYKAYGNGVCSQLIWPRARRRTQGARRGRRTHIYQLQNVTMCYKM
eukprot:464046-Rhodomonas_salina.1